MSSLHFIRPWWFLALIPMLCLLWLVLRQNPRHEAWAGVCDNHLLQHLMQKKGQPYRTNALFVLFLSAFFMIISLSGPSWSLLPVPSYQPIQPRVVVLDLSDNMLAGDLTPNRLTRAKFKLHDLFKQQDVGQFGLVVYTGEPFVVSPLTDDAQTIDALLSSLSPDVMPIEGQRLDLALEEAGQLITNAGYDQGQILVLTGEVPSQGAINVAKSLSAKKIDVSVMPMVASQPLSPLFNNLAKAGNGQLVKFSSTSTDLARWLKNTHKNKRYGQNKDNEVSIWRDEGRWFLIPALILLLPVFRRSWLQRITT